MEPQTDREKAYAAVVGSMIMGEFAMLITSFMVGGSCKLYVSHGSISVLILEEE